METRKGGCLALLAAAAALGCGACSSIRVNKEQVGSVRKVALAGFGVQQRVPNTVLGVLSGPDGDGAVPGLRAAPLAKASAHAAQMYDSLAGRLGKEMGWSVVPRAELARTQAYRAFHGEKTGGFQLRPMVSGRNIEVFTPEGVVEGYLLTTLSPERRRELIRALGVDAIAVATVQVELENRGGLMKLVGAGELHPRATVAFQVYDAAHDDAIWADAYAAGEASAEGTEHALGFAGRDSLDRQAVSASASAYDKLLARYRAE